MFVRLTTAQNSSTTFLSTISSSWSPEILVLCFALALLIGVCGGWYCRRHQPNAVRHSGGAPAVEKRKEIARQTSALKPPGSMKSIKKRPTRSVLSRDSTSTVRISFVVSNEKVSESLSTVSIECLCRSISRCPMFRWSLSMESRACRRIVHSPYVWPEAVKVTHAEAHG